MYHNWYEVYMNARQKQEDLYRRSDEARRADEARRSRKEQRKQARARRLHSRTASAAREPTIFDRLQSVEKHME